MNLLKLSASYIFRRPLSSALNFLLLTFGIGVAVLLLIFSTQLEKRFSWDLYGIDLVVGAKGSPLQLVLSTLLHLDIPTGNIPESSIKKIAESKLVKRAYPIALGDSYHGFPIMGAGLSYMTKFSRLNLEEGYWPTRKMEALIGYQVAKRTGLRKGDHFIGSHGFGESGEEHKEFPYTVTGVLDETGLATDRLILTQIDTVRYIHAHHDEDEESHSGKSYGKKEPEITALLITYETPAAANILPHLVNSIPGLQAASPAFEVSRLLGFLGLGLDTVTILSYSLIIMAGLGIFITLLKSLRERGHDIAIMRALGAGRKKIFSLLVLEGLIYSGLGALSGIIAGHIAAEILGHFTSQSHHITFSGLVFYTSEIYIFFGAILIGMLAATVPAIMAYRIDIAKNLSHESL